MVALHKERVRAVFTRDESTWQSLLDFCYVDWNLPENKGWSLEDMLNNARFTYGEVVELACLLGKYNQQVTNGGHMQYFDNGYSGSHPKRFSEYDYSVPLAERMVELLEQFKLSETELGKQVTKIAKDFIFRTTNYTESDYDEDEDEGGGDKMPGYDDLDTAYYKLDEAWTKELERYFSLWIEFGEDPIATGRF